MGIFSDSTEKYVQVANSKIFDSTQFPNTLRDAVNTAIYKNEDITTHLQIASFTNFTANARKYVRYGESTYYRGFPSSTSSYYDVDRQEIIDIIETDEGANITLLTATIVEVVSEYEGYEYLQDTYGWSIKVNELTHLSTVYNLVDIDYEFKEHCDDEEDPECTTPNARFKFNLSEKASPTTFLVLYVDHPEGNGQRYNVSYHLDTNPADDIVYWTYIISEGTYPQLDSPAPFPIDGTFYPIAVLRKGWRNINATPTTEDYITTKKLLDIIKLDIDTLTDALNESQSIADVLHAFITLSLDMDTEVAESISYLFSFFRELFFLSTITKAAYIAGQAGGFFQSNNF